MFKSQRSKSKTALWLVALITVLLSSYTMFVPVASAEGNAPVVPGEQIPGDTIPGPQPFVQPDDIGFFDLVVLYLDVIF
jgi:hypothetical protein